MDISSATENETKMEKSKDPTTAVLYSKDTDLEEHSFNAGGGYVDEEHMLEDINYKDDVRNRCIINDDDILTVEVESIISFSEDRTGKLLQ